MTNKRNSIKLDGVITTVTGLSINRPNDNFMGGGHSDKMGRLPRTTYKQQNADVFIPGASLRGSLRRAAVSRIRSLIAIAKGVDEPQFNLAEHYMLVQGTDITNKVVGEKSAGTVDKEEALRNANPALSLFGRWKLSGHLAVSSLIPDDNDCLMVDGKGVRTNDFIRTPENITLLSADEQANVRKILEGDALASKEIEPIKTDIAELKKSIKLESDNQEKERIKQEIAALELEIKAVKENKKIGGEAIQRPLDGYEAIKPGVEIPHQLNLQRVNDSELGLAIEMLAEFAREPVFGGHKNHGYGRVSMNYDISHFPVTSDKPIVIGKIIINDEGFVLEDFTEEKWLENARKTFKENINNDAYDFGKFLLED